MALGSPYVFHSCLLPQSLLLPLSFFAISFSLCLPLLPSSTAGLPSMKSYLRIYSSLRDLFCPSHCFLHFTSIIQENLFLPVARLASTRKFHLIPRVVRNCCGQYPQSNHELQIPTSHPCQVKVETTLSFLFKFPCRWQVQCY